MILVVSEFEGDESGRIAAPRPTSVGVGLSLSEVACARCWEVLE